MRERIEIRLSSERTEGNLSGRARPWEPETRLNDCTKAGERRRRLIEADSI